MKRTLIKQSQQGWIVYLDNNPDDFYLFKSNEPERLVKFICERVAGIKMDQMVEARQQEIKNESSKIDEAYGRTSSTL